jgi:hypothetical protein
MEDGRYGKSEARYEAKEPSGKSGMQENGGGSGGGRVIST